MILYLTYRVTAFAQNCRFLFQPETKKTVVVDPGGEVEALMKKLKDNHLEAVAILLTHGHRDHAGGAAALARNLNIDVWGPGKEDSELLASLDQQSRAFNLPLVEGMHSDHYLTDGMEIDLGLGEKIKVIHTPGHTPGGMSYYFAQSGFVLTGDTLFRESVGRSDFPGGSASDLISSIKNKLFVLPDNTKVLPGHGEESTISWEKECNDFVR